MRCSAPSSHLSSPHSPSARGKLKVLLAGVKPPQMYVHFLEVCLNQRDALSYDGRRSSNFTRRMELPLSFVSMVVPYQPFLASLNRGCTLGAYKDYNFHEDRKSLILGVWAAPGAPETRAKGGGRSPPPV